MCDCTGRQLRKLKKLAAKMANELTDLWVLGDGEGGYVLNVIRMEFDQAISKANTRGEDE